MVLQPSIVSLVSQFGERFWRGAVPSFQRNSVIDVNHGIKVAERLLQMPITIQDIAVTTAIGLSNLAFNDGLGIPTLCYGEDWIQVMIHKHVSGCFISDKDITGISVREELAGGVEDAPSRNHIVLVGVVLDVWDGKCSCRGRSRGFGFDGACRRVVEMGSGGAEYVDLLFERSQYIACTGELCDLASKRAIGRPPRQLKGHTNFPIICAGNSVNMASTTILAMIPP